MVARFWTWFAALGLATACAVPVSWAAAAPSVLSLNAALATALRHNPGLAAARHALGVAHGRARQAGLYPNPRIAIGASMGAAFGDPGDYGAHILVTQALPLGSRLRLRAHAARVGAQVVQDRRQAQIWALKARVGQEYLALAVAQKAVAMTARAVAMNRVFARGAKARYRAAQASILDVDAARYALNRVRLIAARWRMRRHRLRARLVQTLGQAPKRPWIVAIPHFPAHVAPTSIAKVWRHSPDAIAAEQEIVYARAVRRWQQARVFGPVTVGVGIGMSRTIITGAPPQPVNHAALFSLKIPLPLWNRHQGDRQAANARLSEAQASRDALLWRMRQSLRRTRENLRFWQQRLRRDRQLQMRMARDIRIALRGYGLGQVQAATVLTLLADQARLTQDSLRASSKELAAHWTWIMVVTK